MTIMGAILSLASLIVLGISNASVLDVEQILIQQHQQQQQQQQQNDDGLHQHEKHPHTQKYDPLFPSPTSPSSSPSSPSSTSSSTSSISASSSSSLLSSSSSISPLLSDEEYLLKYLFEDYNPSARPVMRSNQVVEVNLRFSLLQIQELNVRNQILTSTGFLILEWSDERLAWSKNISSLDELVVKGDNIWTPEFAVINGVDSIYGEYSEFQAIIKPNGTIRWEPGGIFKTMCSINIAYYPFDTQSCVMKFGAWSYITTKMNLSTTETSVRRDTYEENGEWEVTSTSAERQEFAFEDFPTARYSYIQFSIELKRRHTFYIMNVIVPGLLTSTVLLSLFYCVPSQKVHIGVAALLSFRLFLVNVADTVPRTSDHVPLLGVYLTCTMAITTLAMVATVFVGNLYERKDRPVPKWVKTLLFGHMAKILCMRHHVANQIGGASSGGSNKRRRKKRRGEPREITDKSKNRHKNKVNSDDDENNFKIISCFRNSSSNLFRCSSSSCLADMSQCVGSSSKNSADNTDDDNSSEIRLDEEMHMMATYNPRNRRTKIKTQKATKNVREDEIQDSKKPKKVERSRSFDVSSALAMMAKRQIGDLDRFKAGMATKTPNVLQIPISSLTLSPPPNLQVEVNDKQNKLETAFMDETNVGLRCRNATTASATIDTPDDNPDTTTSSCSTPNRQVLEKKKTQILNYAKDWAHLAAVCDRFFFWLCFCFILGTTAMLFHPKLFRRSLADNI